MPTATASGSSRCAARAAQRRAPGGADRHVDRVGDGERQGADAGHTVTTVKLKIPLSFIVKVKNGGNCVVRGISVHLTEGNEKTLHARRQVAAAERDRHRDVRRAVGNPGEAKIDVTRLAGRGRVEQGEQHPTPTTSPSSPRTARKLSMSADRLLAIAAIAIAVAGVGAGALRGRLDAPGAARSERAALGRAPWPTSSSSPSACRRARRSSRRAPRSSPRSSTRARGDVAEALQRIGPAALRRLRRRRGPAVDRARAARRQRRTASS